jgi:hypothetical protein
MYNIDMTTFTYTGTAGCRDISITWTDGVLSATTRQSKLVTTFARGYEGHLLGSSWTQMSVTDHLKNPYVMADLMADLFVGRPTMTGALPKIPDPPEGAVR